MITSEYEPFRIADPGATIYMTPDADGPALHVHEKINGENMAFSNLIIRCSYFSFLMDS